MKIKYSIVVSIILAFSFVWGFYATTQAQAFDLYKFKAPEIFKLDRSQGNANLPDAIRSIERIQVIGYKQVDSLWNVNHGKNIITYRKYMPLFPVVAGIAKKTASEILDIVRTALPSYFSAINTSYYQSSPTVFASTDSKCATASYKPYCNYRNSVIVLYPFLFQNLPVYHEDLSIFGLMIIADESTGEILTIRGLIRNETEVVTVTAERKLSDAQKINAYVLRGRLYDEESYLIPVFIDDKIHDPIDLLPFGFLQLQGQEPPLQGQVPPQVQPVSNEKIYQIDTLKVSIPQDKGIQSQDTVRTSVRFKSISILEGGSTAGRLLFIKKRYITFKDFLLRRNASMVFESRDFFVVSVPSVGADKELLMNALQSITFEEKK